MSNVVCSAPVKKARSRGVTAGHGYRPLDVVAVTRIGHGAGRPRTRADVMWLQARAGNAAVVQLLRLPPVQRIGAGRGTAGVVVQRHCGDVAAHARKGSNETQCHAAVMRWLLEAGTIGERQFRAWQLADRVAGAHEVFFGSGASGPVSGYDSAVDIPAGSIVGFFDEGGGQGGFLHSMVSLGGGLAVGVRNGNLGLSDNNDYGEIDLNKLPGDRVRWTRDGYFEVRPIEEKEPIYKARVFHQAVENIDIDHFGDLEPLKISPQVIAEAGGAAGGKAKKGCCAVS